ncbi:MAG TPA: DUF481 domain-containing protein [Polyangiales bacterium]|nr:DUF481 domain-containing protein [Polyangiales bacterium]
MRLAACALLAAFQLSSAALLCARVHADALPPLQPAPDGYDWVQIWNGEWLKGWITWMRDGTLVFESETFSEVYPDWDSVVKLYTGMPHTFVLRDRTVIVALAALEDGQLRVGDRVIAPKEVLIITAGGANEWEHWDFNFKSGFTFYHSSTSQLTWSNSVWVQRENGVTRASVSYEGAIGQVDGDLTVNSHTGSGKFDILITDRVYAQPFFGSLRHDQEQNIALRATLGAGGGVRIVDAGAGSWDLEFGPAYISTLAISSEAGPVEQEEDFGLVLSTRAKFDVAKDLTLSASWMSAFTLTGTSRSYHHGTAAVEFDLTNIFSLDLSFVFDRIEQAVTTEDGRVPEQNELQVVVGLGVKL